MAVDARAHLEVADKQFAQGETVAVGTEFTFGVALHNQTHKDLHSGDFSVVFSVLDSSLVAIHSESVDAKANAYVHISFLFSLCATVVSLGGSCNVLSVFHSCSKPFRFAYTLRSSNLPSGDLVFKFEVVSATGVVHTTETVKYQLSIPMIATQITFEGVAEGAPKYKYVAPVSPT